MRSRLFVLRAWRTALEHHIFFGEWSALAWDGQKDMGYHGKLQSMAKILDATDSIRISNYFSFRLSPLQNDMMSLNGSIPIPKLCS